jgi:hypothetical protein
MKAFTFTAPTTAAEAEAMMGQHVTCPDGVIRKIGGCGLSGMVVSLSFGKYDKTGKVEATWSTTHGFELRADRARRVWDAEWHALKADDWVLIESVFPGISTRADRETCKAGQRLLSAAKARLVKDGRLEHATCSRCGGCGRYSYNQIDGDRCFGCNGTGKAVPSTRAALRAIRCA